MADRRAALVTGAARGIGAQIALALAHEGCDVAAMDVLAPADTAAGVEAAGRRALAVVADVADAAARAAALAQVEQAFGRLDVLVNNAGVAPKVRADILEATEESFQRVLKINLQGPYFLTQAVARWMVEQKRTDAACTDALFAGCIVNVSSISATVASPFSRTQSPKRFSSSVA